MRSPQQRSIETRTKLLDAAESLIAQFGPDAVTLRDIGRAAEQNNNSVCTYHFKTHENLLRALLDRAITFTEPLTPGAAGFLASMLTSSWRMYVWDHPTVVAEFGTDRTWVTGSSWALDLIRDAYLTGAT